MADIASNNIRIAPQTGAIGHAPASERPPKGGPSFEEALRGLRDLPKPIGPMAPTSSSIKFSNHAVERMQSRGLSFSPEQLQRIDQAVAKAAEKGAKETLLLTDEAALIVSVKNNTVVTVMDKAALKNNVFTNIDSTVMI